MAQLDIAAIAWKSWSYVKQHRFLWGLGILTGGGGSYYSFLNTNPYQSSSLPSSTASASDTERLAKSVETWIAAHGAEVRGIVIGAIVIGLIFLYISYASRAGLMLSVNYLEEKGEDDAPSFSEAYHDGKQFVWKLLGVGFSLAFLAFVIAIAVAILLSAPFTSSSGFANGVTGSLLVVLGMIVLLLFFIPWAYFSERAVVLGGYGVGESIRRGWALMTANLVRTCLAAVGGALSSLVLGLVFGIIVACVALLFVGLGFAAYVSFHMAGITLGIWTVLAVLFLALCMVTGGISGAFTSAYWTIAYRALAYLSLEDAKEK